MSNGRLSELQVRVLRALAGIEPPWTLSGGGALALAHLKHRATRDVDLFWHGRSLLLDLPEVVERRLTADGLGVARVQTADSFCRLGACFGAETTVVDLVATPVALAESPTQVDLDGRRIQIDTMHEILVNKLCTLLSRSEVRDLLDIRALLAAGGDLHRALADAPLKDGGFSALTLAWVLRGQNLRAAARAEKLTAEEEADLLTYREELIDLLTAAGTP